MKRRITHLVIVAIAGVVNYLICSVAVGLGIGNELAIALFILLYIIEQAVASTWNEVR